MDRKTGSKGDKVLRASDVIPPFDTESRNPSSRGSAGEKKRGRKGGDPNPQPAQALEQRTAVPSFDLAESILSEQRRVTAKRRKRAAQANPDTGTTVSSRRPTYIDELSSEEQAELQEVVAEIVARDIERLCHGPNSPTRAPATANGEGGPTAGPEQPTVSTGRRL
jgi:hypothetical protein